MKTPFKAILLALLVCSGLKSSAQVAKLIAQLHNPADKNVMVASHRGDWRNAPENSLKAYELAIAMGVDIIEVDLAKTSDGVVVIMHDQSIERTTNGKGKPSDYTLAELKNFHLKNGLGRLTKHTIPTLEEVMLLAKGKVLVNLDKSYACYEEAYQVLKSTGTLDHAIFKTDKTYAELQQTYPALLKEITFMGVVNISKPGARTIISDYQQAIKPVAFELNFSTDTVALLNDKAFFRNGGSKIWLNSLWASLNAGHEDDLAFDEGNTKDSWDWLIAHGATILQTDRPAMMLDYLRKKKLHK